MRIDPANSVEMEIADLKKQVEELKAQCEMYFNQLEKIRPVRDGWKSNRTSPRYGNRF